MGKKLSEITYKNGIKDGKYTFYTSDSIRESVIYKNKVNLSKEKDKVFHNLLNNINVNPITLPERLSYDSYETPYCFQFILLISLVTAVLTLLAFSKLYFTTIPIPNL